MRTHTVRRVPLRQASLTPDQELALVSSAELDGLSSHSLAILYQNKREHHPVRRSVEAGKASDPDGS